MSANPTHHLFGPGDPGAAAVRRQRRQEAHRRNEAARKAEERQQPAEREQGGRS